MQEDGDSSSDNDDPTDMKRKMKNLRSNKRQELNDRTGRQRSFSAKREEEGSGFKRGLKRNTITPKAQDSGHIIKHSGDIYASSKG